jgi:flagellar operon protein
MSDRPFLYPNVTSIPAQRIEGEKAEKRKPDGVKSDFDLVFEESAAKLTPKTALKSGSEKTSQGDEGKTGDKLSTRSDSKLEGTHGLTKDLSEIKQPLKFSSHAAQRLQERKINLDQATMMKVTDAVDKADAKGIEDTLVLTGEAALIVNVKNRTVITAMDKQSLTGNVFTNIDGAVIV